MTDTIEAVALKLRTDLDEAAKQHMPAMVVTTDYLRTVLDTIAAQKAEIERLTEREAQAKLDGVRAEKIARIRHGALLTIATGGFKGDKCRQIAREALNTVCTAALDAEAIAKGIITAAALSDLIAGDADLIAPDTLADSDGDDGA